MENNTVTQVENLVDLDQVEEIVTRKHPASLGKLNRVTAKAAQQIVDNGHRPNRFKRDYKNGVATYVCSDCNKGAVAVASEFRGKSTVTGEALSVKCTFANQN